MRIGIAGNGFLGIILSTSLAELGHDVVCSIGDAERAEELNRGTARFEEKFVPELLQRHRNTRLRFTADPESAARDARVVYLAIDSELDPALLEETTVRIANALAPGALVVLASVAVLGTYRRLERCLRLNGATAELAVQPEAVQRGRAVCDFLYPDRLIFGVETEAAAATLREIFEPLISGTFHKRPDAIPEPDDAVIPPSVLLVSRASAEVTAVASATFLAVKSAFVNRVAEICERVDADIHELCAGMGSDTRIGSRNLCTNANFAGLRAAVPVETLAQGNCGLSRIARAALEHHSATPAMIVQQLRRQLWTLRDKRVALLGLSVAPDTDHLAHSAALEIARLLRQERCSLTAYDTLAREEDRFLLGAGVKLCLTVGDALNHADAAILLSPCDELRSLDWSSLAKKMRYPIVVDACSLYPLRAMEEAGVHYCSFGRRVVTPEIQKHKQRRVS